MQPTIRYLLLAAQIVYVPVRSDWSNPGCTELSVYKAYITNTETPYLTGEAVGGFYHYVTNLRILRDITEEDNLTVSYTVDEMADEKVSGVPFCMENTSTDVDGSMVKITRLALKLPAERCPIKSTNLGRTEARISVWGLRLPAAPQQQLRINELVAPGHGPILSLFVSNLREL